MADATTLAVSFDFDNTLLLSEACKHSTMRELCARYPHGLDVLATIPTDSRTAPPGVTVTRHTIFATFAQGLRQRGALPSDFEGDESAFGKFLCEKFSALLEQRLCEAREVPGAAAMLKHLKQQGVAMYVNTATPQEPIDQLVDALGWREYFCGVYGAPGTKVSNLEKVAAAARVGDGAKRRIVHVGDGDNDCKAASDFGCKFIGVKLAPELGGAPPATGAGGGGSGFSRECVDIVPDMHGALAALCPLLGVPLPPPRRRSLATGCRGRCCDLGFPISEGSVSWPTCKPLARDVLKAPATTEPPGARSKQAFTLNGGTGTHIDAPAHFIPRGRTVDGLTAEELVQVPLAIVDCDAPSSASDASTSGGAGASGKRARDGGPVVGDEASRRLSSSSDDRLLSVDDILADEGRHGPIPHGALVCVRTGWAATRYDSRDAYYNAYDPSDVDPYAGLPRMHFPGISAEAATFLVEKRAAVGVGIDTLSPDGGDGAARGFPAHHVILGADRYILENLRLAADAPNRGATATVAPLNIVGAPETPARVWAVLTHEEVE